LISSVIRPYSFGLTECRGLSTWMCKVALGLCAMEAAVTTALTTKDGNLNRWNMLVSPAA
jgi:hypothetical protein